MPAPRKKAGGQYLSKADVWLADYLESDGRPGNGKQHGG